MTHRTVPIACQRALAMLVVLASACSTRAADDSFARGHGRSVATLSTTVESEVIEAAIRTAFDVEPALILRMHPRRLARTAGDSGGTPVAPELVRALRARGMVQGTCDPIRTSPTKDTPRCRGPEAGYIVRASEPFAVSADTVEINFAAEKFGAETGQKPEALRFEWVYQVAKDGPRWRVVREARVRE